MQELGKMLRQYNFDARTSAKGETDEEKEQVIIYNPA